MNTTSHAFDTLNGVVMHPPTEGLRDQLKSLLVERSLTFDDVQLSSGEQSSVYVDGKLTTCHSKAMPLVGQLFLEKIAAHGWAPKAVGGLTVGADPIAFAIARESIAWPGAELDSFIVRKEAKKHGKQKFIEGLRRYDVPVVIIDDVCTSGKSTGNAIERAREAGLQILGAACLVDRRQGASELLREKFGLTLTSIFTLDELTAFHYATNQQPAGV